MILAAAALALLHNAQNFEQRGFLELRNNGYFQTAPNDSARYVGESLLRYEATWRPKPWLKLTTGFDGRFDTHRQFDRDLRLDFEDRRIQRPALSLRRFSAQMHKGNWTFEVGRQFIRWGKTDLLNPTDRFAPKDFLNVAYSDFMAVPAARLTFERGSDTIDVVVQARFTPSRGPLLNQRWVSLPAQLDGVRLLDRGARYPGGTPAGIRWNHIARGYEYSLMFYEGHNHLPLFEGKPVSFAPVTVAAQRYYPHLRQYGADFAAPLRWFTVKAESAYYTSKTRDTDEFLLYVVQLERLVGEWTFVGGYAGEVVTKATGNQLTFFPDRGMAKAFLGRAAYTIDPNRSVAFDTAVRQNGEGFLGRLEYSQTFGQHWRATAQLSAIRGASSDFLGQYRRNSSAALILRYSF
ncbi:MAG: hypothetical protein JST65_01300 [Acidobacteria bacterium]|nr:hypothetical protein [Acidobacteriota bacterium]